MTPFPPHLLAPKYWPSWIGAGLLFMLAWLPWQTRRWLGLQIGGLLYKRNHKRRHVALTNLRLCFPELDGPQHQQLALQHLQEYACALLDYSLLFFRSRQWLYRRIRVHGQEHINRAIAVRQNVILLVAHSVWLEFAGVGLGKNYRLVGFYKSFRNPVVNWLIARSRSNDAETLLSRQEGMMKLVRTLEPGRLIFFLPDEDHGIKHSVFAPFFGVPKATLTTPARLAKLGKAVALPVMAFFNAESGTYDVVVNAALPDFHGKDEQQDALTLNAGLETLIRQDTRQYMWLLKLFRTRPQGEGKLY